MPHVFFSIFVVRAITLLQHFTYFNPFYTCDTHGYFERFFCVSSVFVLFFLIHIRKMCHILSTENRCSLKLRKTFCCSWCKAYMMDITFSSSQHQKVPESQYHFLELFYHVFGVRRVNKSKVLICGRHNRSSDF